MALKFSIGQTSLALELVIKTWKIMICSMTQDPFVLLKTSFDKIRVGD